MSAHYTSRKDIFRLFMAWKHYFLLIFVCMYIHRTPFCSGKSKTLFLVVSSPYESNVCSLFNDQISCVKLHLCSTVTIFSLHWPLYKVSVCFLYIIYSRNDHCRHRWKLENIYFKTIYTYISNIFLIYAKAATTSHLMEKLFTCNINFWVDIIRVFEEKKKTPPSANRQPSPRPPKPKPRPPPNPWPGPGQSNVASVVAQGLLVVPSCGLLPFAASVMTQKCKY